MSSITNVRINPVYDDSGHSITQVASAGNPQYVTRTAGGNVRIRATVTVTAGDGTTANRAFSGIYIQRYTLSGDYIGGVEWYFQGSRGSAGSLDIDQSIPANANERWDIHVKLLKRITGSPGYTWNNNLQLVDFQTSILTDRNPDPVVITSPGTGVTLLTGESLNLVWAWSDPDDGSSGGLDGQDYRGWQVQVRPGPTIADPNPTWGDPTLYSNLVGQGGAARPPYLFDNADPYISWDDDVAYALTIFAANAGVAIIDGTARTLRLSSGTWQLRVRGFDDSSGTLTDPATIDSTKPWSASPWSDSVTVYVIGSTLPPILNAPANNEAVYGDVDFSWMFQTPIAGAFQREWQVFVREVGQPDYIQIAGGPPNDGLSTWHWVNGSTYGGVAYTMLPGHQYEWVGVTEDNSHLVSDPSLPEQFWYTEAPESGPEIPLPEITVPDPGLGCGHNRAFLFRRGGKIPLGEITGITKIVWGRIRDDISSCDITVQDWSDDCGALLASVRSWQHEIVVFRDNGAGLKRVWEGPVTRPSYEVDTVTIEAKDVMGYVYRRILRQGYNDAYRKVNGAVQGLTTVTARSRQIIQNALAYDDPNVLAYLWVLIQADDAKQSRVVPDWSRSAWQDVDDMAAKAGLDYTTVGRRIMLWDTHNPIGTLPEMRDGDFDKPPIVTEYGMQLANVYGVTNNNGVWGSATRRPGDFYGYVEMLVSAWGESDDNGQPETLTAEAAAALKETLNGQADRGINQRWPTPLVVRVPDNSTLSPDLSIGINQLIPGVYIPLQSTATLRRVTQMQKLDNVTVTETKDGETVQVTLSPAPTSRDYDPDSDDGGDE